MSNRGGVRITRPEALNRNLAKYRVLGRQAPEMGSVWFYGSHHRAERAIRRLRYLEGLMGTDDIFRRGIRGEVEVKVYRYLHTPSSVEYFRFWIEDDDSVNVTQKLLTEFVHDPNNEKKEKLITWATEEVMRREVKYEIS